jgi:7-cyano-7-deazaguanine synthase
VPSTSSTAVLISAGLDSVVLAAHEARRGRVHPVYVSTGLSWEGAELSALGQLLTASVFQELAPLTRLTFGVDDLYPATHWARRGVPPAFDTPDEDVYLMGRNIALLAKTAIHCAQKGIGRVALGLLAGNPFPDATAEFFEAMSRALTLGLDHRLEIDAPFAGRTKADVIRVGMELDVPLALTLSCMNPQNGLHCGGCSKCRERRDAFREAGVPDPTHYASAPVR